MSVSAAENAGPGPGELQDPLWVKMNAITGGITKKRKKSDAKPQSQINKCLNEKRRRTQENLYIDELAELISATDMSSGKTDKCQILQRTVDQIRHIRQQEGTNSHAVQQGEVSSSNPGILSNDQVGPILLEALDGFLFVVNTEGRVEHVTDNIQQYLNYTKDDVLGKVIYNIIHHGDHQSFMPNLLPISLGLTNVDPQAQTRNRMFSCRFLVKPPDDKDETMEEKQQRVFKYETMHISSALLPNTSDHMESGDVSSESSEIGPCILCVARRIPVNEKPINTATIQQFTVKLDTTGRIIAVDTSWLTQSYSQYLNKDLIGSTIQDLCHPHDLNKITAHLKNTLQAGEGTSSIYRLRMNADEFLNVQTKSKLFKANVMNGHDTDFIMSTNSIIGPLQESTSLLGGVINGKDAISAGGASTTSSSSATPSRSTSALSASSTPPIQTSCTTIIVTSGTSTSSTTVMSSLSTITATQSTITTMTSTTHATQASAPTNNLMTTTDNSSLGSGDSGRLRNLLTKGTSASSEDTQEICGNNDNDNPNDHRILKNLLNQQDEDDYHLEHSTKVRSSPSVQQKSIAEHSKPLGNNMLLQLLNDKSDEDDETRAGMKQQNELLQQLLKEPNEDRKMQNPNRDSDSLLRSLGFQSVAPSSSKSVDHGHHGPQIGQKRPNEDDLNTSTKRTMDDSHELTTPESTTNEKKVPKSRLQKDNQMLAELLAREPAPLTSIPPISASEIAAIPQEKLPQVTDRVRQQQHPQAQPTHGSHQQPWTAGGMQQPLASTSKTTVATSARTPLQNQSRQLPRQSTNIYLSHMLSHERPQIGQMDSEFASSGDFNSTGNDTTNAWNNQTTDRTPDDILDLVINLDPEGKPIPISDSQVSQNMMNPIELPQSEELVAIDSIQKFLMAYENEKANATSSTMTLSSTPPAYSTALGSGMSVTTAHNYQAPPLYQQQQARARFSGQAGIRQANASFTPQQQAQQQQQQLLHRSKIIQQQQLKHRLLQVQQQQHLVIPSNATAPDQIAAGIHNIDSLLNNTVAPNVSLQRSSVSDSQMSPGYGGSVQLPATHRLQHSYSHPATITQHPVNNNFNTGQPVSAPSRLSPHSPAGMLSFSHPQPLSPRVSQGSYANTPRMFNVNQARAQQQPNQQLQQQQRSMPSPGTVVSARQSPFPAEAFPPPASPTASQFPPIQNQTGANPSASYRLQRATSTPTATTQLPGGVGSPRHYGVKDQQSMLSPSHQRQGCQQSTHNVTNSQHFNQQQQQHSSMIYRNSGSNLNTQDVQSNQYCCDQGALPIYSSGPEDNRSMSSSNPASHQMSGTTSGPGSMTSEFVRQELRAVVGARTQQRVPNNIQSNLIGQVSQDDLEALGLSFEMSPAGEAVVSDGPAKSWAIGSAGSAPSSSRNTMEEVVRGDPKSSLLQKLLSE